MRRGWDGYALQAAASGRVAALMDLRRLLCGHPLDEPKLPERRLCTRTVLGTETQAPAPKPASQAGVISRD